MEEQELNQSGDQLEEWERIHRQENGLTLEERKVNQLAKLKQIVESLHTVFGSSLMAATKSARKEPLSREESGDLQSTVDKDELIDRVNGLIKAFGEEYYQALKGITGQSFIISEQTGEPVLTEPEESPSEAGSTRASKLPKGYNKWDLKQVKLHESRPADGKRIWVEFWSLRGISDLGEILYNPTKDLFYFKPHDTSNSSFALTDEHGRKLTHQARNYYFRPAPNPPTAE